MKWISVEDRLPEKPGRNVKKYLVTLETGKVTIAEWIYDFDGEPTWGCTGVIAWAEFPEPYKRGGK